MVEQVCRLCLSTICGNDFQTLGHLRDMLEALLLNITYDISLEAVVCYKCVKNLQESSNLISTYVNGKDMKLPLINFKKEKSHPDEVSNTSKNIVTNQKVCFLCAKSLGMWDYVSLGESKENMFIIDMLQKHIPKWNLNHADELLTCHICLDTLQSLQNFIANCLDVEEKIKMYIEVEGTNDKGQVELANVQKFTIKPVSKYDTGGSNMTGMEEADDEFEKNIAAKIEANIKNEQVDNADLNIKPEELDVMLNRGDCDSSTRTPDLSYDASKNPLDVVTYKCDLCTFRSNNKGSLKRHLLLHSDSSEIMLHKCGSCLYETKFKRNLKSHMLKHKNPSELTMHRCETCLYMTRNKRDLKRHMIIHTNVPEFCAFQAKYKSYLKGHKLTHEIRPESHVKCPSIELKVHQCDSCSFQTRYKKSLQGHSLMHKNPAEITMHQCEVCLYKTKIKDNLKKHMVTHIDVSELTCTSANVASSKQSIKRALRHTC